MSALFACISLCHMHVWCLWSPEKSTEFPGTEFMDGCELLCVLRIEPRSVGRAVSALNLLSSFSILCACLLILPKTTCPELALPHQLLIKKMLHIYTHKSVWWSQFLSWGCLFHADSSLFQVEKNWPGQHWTWSNGSEVCSPVLEGSCGHLSIH